MTMKTSDSASNVYQILLSGFSVLVKVISGFAITVLLARVNSPEDFGVLGQYMSFASILVLASTLGIQTKLIKDFSTGKGLANGSFICVLVLALLSSCAVIFVYVNIYQGYASQFSRDIISPHLSVVFCIFTIYVLMNVLLAAANGAGDVGAVSRSNVIAPALGLVAAVLLFKFNGKVEWQVYFLMTYPLIKLPFIFHYLLKIDIGQWRKERLSIAIKAIPEYGPFMVMTLTSTVLIATFHTFTRAQISEQINWTAAGQLQVLYKHSDVVMLLFSSFVNLFLIRRLAQLNFQAQSKYVSNLVKIISLPSLTAFLIGAWIGPVHMPIIFGDEYSSAKEMLVPWLLGDLIRIFSYALIVPIVVSGFLKRYLILEFIQYFILFTSFGLFQNFSKSYHFFYPIAHLLYFMVVVVIIWHWRNQRRPS